MDMKRLNELIYDFYLISGIELAILDGKYHSIQLTDKNQTQFCNIIHHNQKYTDLCIESDLDNLEVVNKSLKTVSYTCPFGFFSAIAPILSDDTIVAYLMLGPVREKNVFNDDFPLLHLDKIFKISNKAELQDSIQSIPVYPREKLEAYTRLLDALASQIEKEKLIPYGDQGISHLIKRYIDHGLKNKITLSDLSWKFHCSTVTLTEHFKRDFGISIMQYTQNKRMEQAKLLLESGKHSLKYIALECGFKDMEYFSRTFKKHFGISPSQWQNTKKEL